MIVNWRDADSQVLLADDCYRAAPAVTKTTDDSCELSSSSASSRRIGSTPPTRCFFASLSLPLSLYFSLPLSSSFSLFLSFSAFEYARRT